MYEINADFEPAKRNLCTVGFLLSLTERIPPSLMEHQRLNPLMMFRPLPLFQSNATQPVAPDAHRNLFLRKTLGV